VGSRNVEFDQSPYEMPSVFNFYLASYQPAGEIVGIVPSACIPNGFIAAPAFQIVNQITSNSATHLFRTIIIGTNNVPKRREIHFGLPSSSTNSAGVLTTATMAALTEVVYDFSIEQGLAASIPGTDSLIERLDYRGIEHRQRCYFSDR